MAEGYRQTFIRLRSPATGEWLVPQELRPKLVAEAERDKTSLSEVVFGILSRHYNVSYKPAGRKTKPSKNGEELNLRLPMNMYQAIARQALRYPRSPQREILATLCAHYGLVLVKPAKRRRAPRAAAA